MKSRKYHVVERQVFTIGEDDDESDDEEDNGIWADEETNLDVSRSVYYFLIR